MKISGQVRKMAARLEETAQYRLPLGDHLVPMNERIGKQVSLEFLGQILCLGCGRPTKKSFSQGYCFSCFTSSPETAECILRPELCQAHLGLGRNPQWEKDHHFQEHVVYLALSSELKVGVTRSTQIPTRWIDQGATEVIRLAVVPYRQLAGQIEVAMKEHFTDKTNWQRMLKNEVPAGIDLVEEKYRSEDHLSFELRKYFSADDSVTRINYPVLEYPSKVKSIDLDKQSRISGKLVGIKGQYLIFEGGAVINIRKYGGYVVEWEDLS